MTNSDGEAPPPVGPASDEGAPPPGWGTDDRISFSKENGKYLQTDEDGSEMEYNSKLKAWMPVVLAPCISSVIVRSMMMN
jgi:hypothetical protein